MFPADVHPHIAMLLTACIAGSEARERAARCPDIVLLTPADLEAWGVVRVLHSGVN